jgi:hypothetical protein
LGIALAHLAAVMHPDVVAVAVTLAVFRLEAHQPPAQMLVDQRQHLIAVVRMNVVCPCVDMRRHLVRPITHHALELRAEIHRTTHHVPVPVPQAIIHGLVQGEAQALVAGAGLGVERQALTDIARHGKIVIASAPSKERGVDFDWHFAAISVAMTPD